MGDRLVAERFVYYVRIVHSSGVLRSTLFIVCADVMHAMPHLSNTTAILMLVSALVTVCCLLSSRDTLPASG
jgi:hypothetical protein